MDTGDLLRRLSQNDLEAIQSVLDQHGQPVLNYLHRMVGDRWAAEDLLQEVMVKLIRSAHTIRDEKSLPTWLYAVARNHALNHIRHKKAVRRNLPEPGAAPMSPDESAARQELSETVQRAVDSLEEPFKTTFVLCSLQGMEYDEAGRVMGCSPKTVSSRLFRAREKFRQIMRPFLYGSSNERL